MKQNFFKIIFSLFMICLLSCTTGLFKTVKSEATVKIYYGGNAQVEIISPKGSRVLIDIENPERLSSPPAKKDILLTTHDHPDHLNFPFIDSFPGQQLWVKEGIIKLEDVVVRGIASCHFEQCKESDLKTEGGSNYIFIIEMAGLRIAHFGDIGQKALTSAQLSALGKVDIAIMQLENPYANMNAENKKALILMDQVKPRLIIPTHIFGSDCAKIAASKWDGHNSHKKFLSVGRDNLPKKTQIIFLSGNTFFLKLPESDL